jgi:hypothetical protein
VLCDASACCATQVGHACTVRAQAANDAPSAQVGEYNIYNIYDTCGDGNMSTVEELFGGASEATPFGIWRPRHRGLWGPRKHPPCQIIAPSPCRNKVKEHTVHARSLHHPHAEIIW